MYSLLHACCRCWPYCYSCDVRLHTHSTSAASNHCAYLDTLESDIKSTYMLKSQIVAFDKWHINNLVSPQIAQF
jgi:hypothetical protein